MAEDGAGAQFGVVQDRYELVEIVGSGGMGVVYRAHDRVLRRTVAVKMIRTELAGDEFVQRFEREAAILARLRSPHIVVVYDYGKHDGQFYMVTDYLTEGDLAGLLERTESMQVPDAVLLMAKLAEGLGDAHDAGVLHRDIKPANILLWKRGGRLHPVLADFGIAVTSDLTLTKTGAVVGSPLYMAPERHMGQPATVASDIYSMGCLLYALVTGQPPYWGGTEFQAASAHLNNPIPTVPANLPFAAEVDEIIADCMAKEPRQRIATADELASRLQTLATRISPSVPVSKKASAPVPTKPSGATTVLSPTDPPPPSGTSLRHAASSQPPSQPPSQSSSSRRWPVLAAVSAVVVVLALAGWWLAAQGDDPDDDPVDADTSDAPTDSSDTSESPPAAPDAPQVKVERGYLEVTFETRLPRDRNGVTYALERKDGGWTSARREITERTDEGDQEACVTLRLVATNAGGSAPGEGETVCGKAEPREVRIQSNPAYCVFSTGRPCRYWDVLLVGFEPGPVTISITSEITGQTTQRGQDSITVEPTGYGTLGSHQEGSEHFGGGFKLDPDAERITVEADGVKDVVTP